MPRAYLRLDPAFDERKANYPDGPYAALIATLCLAEHQPERGRFRSLKYLHALLGRRGRHVHYLKTHGDIVELPDGRIYVDGWDEWQEGDWKVAERVSRIRHRDRATVTSTVTSTVTPPPTSPETHRNSGSGSGSKGVGEASPPTPPPAGGRSSRENGTNPRALADYARRAAEDELEEKRAASRAIHMRYLRGEINEVEERRLYDELDMEPDDLRRRSA